MQSSELLIGAHMSIAGGIEKSLERGQEIGCTAIQLFTHSNRQWTMTPLTAAEISRFHTAKKDSSVRVCVVHASYLINAASPIAHTRKQSVRALIHELERCEQLDIDALVLHPGSATKGAKSDAIKYLAESLDEALEAVPGVTIALENMAGQGSTLGDTFEELAVIKAQCTHKRRIGFCLDTCHAFAAGYAFGTHDEYKEFMHTIDKTIGIAHLAAIHINDSMKPAGSHVDRHAHIGKGKIPLEAFWHIMHDTRLTAVPKILETPKDTLTADHDNITVLKELAHKKRTPVIPGS